MIENHGTNLDGETLQALRLVKDYLIQIGGPQHVKINRKMMESCQNSRMKYEDYKQANEKKGKQEAMSKEEEKAAASEKEKEMAMEAKSFSLQAKVKLADEMIEEGNKLLKAYAIKKVPAIFTEGQEKIEVGLKRRNELQAELEELKKTKRNCGV